MGKYNFIPKLAARKTSKKEEDNFIMLILGDTGSGKSYSAMVTGIMIQAYATVLYEPKEKPVFNSETIIFRADEMMELVDEGLPPQSIIQLDEGGEIADARKWWSDPNDVITSTIDTFRADRLSLIWATPDLDRVDKRIRNEIDVIAQMQGKKQMKVQSVKKDRVSGMVLNPYPKMSKRVLKGATQDGNYANVYVRDLYDLVEQVGKKGLIKKYEKRKKKFINEVQKKGRDRLENKDVNKKFDMMDIAGIMLDGMDVDVNKPKGTLKSLVTGRLKAEYPDYDFTKTSVEDAITFVQEDPEYANEAVTNPMEDSINDKSRNPGMTNDFRENTEDYWPQFKRLYIDKDFNLKQVSNTMNVALKEVKHAYRTVFYDRIQELQSGE